MSVIEYILLALALSVPTAIVLRSSAKQSQVRLSQALIVVLLIALMHAAFLVLGMYLGNLFRFDIPSVDSLVYLGLFIVVAIKLMVPAFRHKEMKVQGYDITRWSTAIALGVATGLNVLLIGIGLGFMVSPVEDKFKAAIPMVVILFVLGYWAVMLGRQKKSMKERRWLLIAVLFLLFSAIFNATDLM